MKNVSIIVNIVLAIAIALLYVLHFSNKEANVKDDNQLTNESKTDVMISSEFSAAWVNIDSVFNNFDMYFDMRKDLEEKGKKMETEMNNRTRVLEKEMMEFQNKAQKGLLLRSEIQQKQQELAEKEQELYRFRDELRMKFAEEEQVKLRQIQHTITEFLNEYNKDKGYYLILSSTFGGPLLYGHPAIDITPEVLKGLNDKYVSARKDKK
jgi:outer membrane protein